MGTHCFPPFVFESRSLQLRKHGQRVKLQRKPALILAALLESPEQPVSREKLSARLWPAGTFVDFDPSLNVAIKKLRDSLGDSAGEPQFIETVAGLGYQFIGEIEPRSETEPANQIEASSQIQPQIEPGPQIVATEFAADGEPQRAMTEQPKRRYGLWFGFALVSVLGAFAIRIRQKRSTFATRDRNSDMGEG